MTHPINLYTIGFTQKTAEAFFTLLSRAAVKRLVDVRLNNTSQLAGFAKKDDLAYFVKAICGAEYIHLPELAPTAELLESYKKRKGDWETYERQFLELMAQRRIEETVPRGLLEGGCLLCSEHEPHHCHRRLVVEYLQAKWANVAVTHLV